MKRRSRDEEEEPSGRGGAEMKRRSRDEEGVCLLPHWRCSSMHELYHQIIQFIMRF